jgi:hypothetical protein
MIDYARSSFTWKSHPWKPDPHYRWMGGFVGVPGQAYHVRFTLQASCSVKYPDDDSPVDVYLGSPCRSEYTIAKRNLFQVPSGEWRMAFSKTHAVAIAESLDERGPYRAEPLTSRFADHGINIREQLKVTEHDNADTVIEATLANQMMNARTTYHDQKSGCDVTLEYPVNVMNLNVEDKEWQVCTGPIIVPDTESWDGSQITRAYLAHVAISAFDHVEIIFRRPVDVTSDSAEWLDKPRGRDRLELRDPDNPPDGDPSSRPRPHVYHDVWGLAAENRILTASP